MRTRRRKPVQSGESRPPVIEENITYRDLYEAIDKRGNLSARQLYYLSRLVKRKLKAFDPRFDSTELEMKPYVVE